MLPDERTDRQNTRQDRTGIFVPGQVMVGMGGHFVQGQTDRDRRGGRT